MQFTRIDHVALEVSELEASVAFYENHFGFHRYADQCTPTGLNIAYLKLGDTVIELVGRKAEVMGGFHFCLISDDFDKAVAALERAGLPCVTHPHPTDAREPTEEGWRRVVFAGLDGEHIEIRG